MKIAIVKNEAENSADVPYVAQVDTAERTIHKETQFEIPIRRLPGASSTYRAEICGFGVRAETAEHLQPKISYVLDSLINVARLPRHVFVARRAGTVYPVYTIGNTVRATTPGGPVFEHVELAKVREYLGDYLHQTFVLGEKGVSDRLHVRGVHMKTLELKRPIFYLKKRVAGETDFWAPVFASEGEQTIYTYAANAWRSVAKTDGSEVLTLRDVVAEALQKDGRLNDLYDLRPDRLLPEYWDKLKVTLTPEGTVTVKEQEHEVYSFGSLWLAVETRPNEERYGLYLGDSESGVRGRMTRDYIRRGKE
jgi:hypothetical protein